LWTLNGDTSEHETGNLANRVGYSAKAARVMKS